MSIYDCQKFLGASSQICQWDDLADQTVMDIGCGKGDNSTRYFVEMYPHIRKLIGIDQNINLINSAQQENSHPKIEYHEADIKEWPTLSQWESQINVVLSFYCFNCMDDKIKVFENVHKLSMPGGTAAVIFTMQADYYDWIKEVGEIYSEYAIDTHLEPPESHTNNFLASNYEHDIAEIGFNILQCTDEYYWKGFESDEDCKDYLIASCPLTSNIPEELMPTFREDIFLIYLKYNPRDENGFTQFICRVANIFIKKI